MVDALEWMQDLTADDADKMVMYNDTKHWPGSPMPIGSGWISGETTLFEIVKGCMGTSSDAVDSDLLGDWEGAAQFLQFCIDPGMICDASASTFFIQTTFNKGGNVSGHKKKLNQAAINSIHIKTAKNCREEAQSKRCWSTGADFTTPYSVKDVQELTSLHKLACHSLEPLDGNKTESKIIALKVISWCGSVGLICAVFYSQQHVRSRPYEFLYIFQQSTHPHRDDVASATVKRIDQSHTQVLRGCLKLQTPALRKQQDDEGWQPYGQVLLQSSLSLIHRSTTTLAYYLHFNCVSAPPPLHYCVSYTMVGGENEIIKGYQLIYAVPRGHFYYFRWPAQRIRHMALARLQISCDGNTAFYSGDGVSSKTLVVDAGIKKANTAAARRGEEEVALKFKLQSLFALDLES